MRRDTLDTQHVYANFHPVIPAECLQSPLLFLANIQPELQLEVLEQVPSPHLTVLDPWNCGYLTAREKLTEVMRALISC